MQSGSKTKSFRTPKGCHVHRISLRADGAVVGWDCGGGGRGSFRSVSGGEGNYPEVLVRGVRTVKLPTGTVSGMGASMGFVLSPRHVKCEKRARDTELSCHLYNDAGLLAGGRRR